MDCPQKLVGLVIGKGGETIKDLQAKSGCSIQIDQNFPDGAPRKITVKGSPPNVELAKTLVSQVLSKSPLAPAPASTPAPTPPAALALPTGLSHATSGALAIIPAATPTQPLVPGQAASAGSSDIDPDVQEFCDRFQIDARMTRMLNDELNKRPDTWEGDLLALYEIIEQARVPAGLLMVKIREMQAGSFVGKPKPDKEIQELGKKYKLDDSATQRLTEVMAKRENRKEDMEKLEKHLRVSNKPSALVMMMLGKFRRGEDIGEPEFKPAPGSYRWEKDVRKEMDLGGSEDKERDKEGDTERERQRERDCGPRDNASRVERDRDRSDRARDRRGGGGQHRDRDRSRDRDNRDRSRERDHRNRREDRRERRDSRERDRDRDRASDRDRDRERDRDRDREKGCRGGRGDEERKERNRTRSRERERRDSREGNKETLATADHERPAAEAEHGGPQEPQQLQPKQQQPREERAAERPAEAAVPQAAASSVYASVASAVLGTAALPAGWASAKDETGRTYYFHQETREVQWESPACSASTVAQAVLPEGWASAEDGSGRTYYYNIATKVTQWEAPTQ